MVVPAFPVPHLQRHADTMSLAHWQPDRQIHLTTDLANFHTSTLSHWLPFALLAGFACLEFLDSSPLPSPFRRTGTRSWDWIGIGIGIGIAVARGCPARSPRLLLTFQVRREESDRTNGSLDCVSDRIKTSYTVTDVKPLDT